MSNTLIATLGGLGAMLMWGISDWLLARGSKKNDVFEMNLMFRLPTLFVSGVLVLMTHRHITSMHNIWIICLASIILSGALLAFIKALAIGASGIVVPVSSIYPLVTLVLSAIFLSISFTKLQILAMVIVVLGVIMLAFEKRNKKTSLLIQYKSTIFALIAAALWGTGFVFQNSVVGKEAWENVLFSVSLTLTIVGFLFLILKSGKNLTSSLVRTSRDRTTLLASLVCTVGSIGFYYSSVRVGSIIITVIVASAAPLVTSALSAIFDGEHLTVMKRAGAVIAITGIILINL